MIEMQAAESHSINGRQLKSVRSESLCQEIKMAKLPRKENSYSMIKIEFNELKDPSLLNAANVANYVGVSFTSKNQELRTYQASLTMVFAVANLLNACFYCYKLTRV